MHVRHAMTLLAIAGLLVIPATSAVGSGGAMASANGSAHWTIPLPNQFGVVVENRTLSFNARKYEDGSVTGRFEYHQVVEGEAFKFNVDVTCLNVYDGNRAKLGGVITVSSDPTLPRRPVRVVLGLRQRRRSRRSAGSVEPHRLRHGGCERGLLQQSEPAPQRPVGRRRERAGARLEDAPVLLSVRALAGGGVRCPRDPVAHLCPGRRTTGRRRLRGHTSQKIAGEHPAGEDAQARALTEQEFAEAEAYEAKWREEDKERFHQERLP